MLGPINLLFNLSGSVLSQKAKQNQFTYKCSQYPTSTAFSTSTVYIEEKEFGIVQRILPAL